MLLPGQSGKGEGRSLISDRIQGWCKFLGRNQRVSRRSNRRKVRKGSRRKERSLIKDRIHSRWRCERKNRRINRSYRKNCRRDWRGITRKQRQ